MLFRLLLLFIVVPLVELTLLVQLGVRTRWWVPIVTVIVTGLVGATLAKYQGLQVFRRMQQQLRANRLPANELLDGLMILVAGLLLITPGMLTDAVGLGLLVPGIRAHLRRYLRRRLEVQFSERVTIVKDRATGRRADEDVIDVEFEVRESRDGDST